MTTAAIQGVRGAFSHAAARGALGADVEVVECRTFEDLFRAVSEGDAERGVVPVENTLAGSVQRNMDLLVQHPVEVVGEVRVRIRLCLAAPPGTALEDVRRVASHPVALEQCLGFFGRHVGIERVTAFDTAGSVRDLMDGRADYDAAISSELAASLYGASVLLPCLEDHPGNYTRFLVVARAAAGSLGTADGERFAVAGVRPAGAGGSDTHAPPAAGGAGATNAADAATPVTKTSIAFTLPHRPGALHRALACFAEHDVDLARIESRPIRGRPWEYRFYVDLRGRGPAVEASALEALRGHATELRVLGRYPEASVHAEG